MPLHLEQDNHQKKDLLRFITAGSVDDGKSTLIGRLLNDANIVYKDHFENLKRVSRKLGNSKGNNLEYALLLDGLKAEREQGITIDVAYRYFSTTRRTFILADTPGHEQYTRNMATGASLADLAIILIDARKGVLPQSKRHSFIATLLGIRHIVVAVNKMDLVDYKEQVFLAIKEEFSDFAARLEVSDLHFIPVSAAEGENVVRISKEMPWYNGGALLHYLETVHIASDRNFIDLRFPIQYVQRPNQDFRGYSGTVVSGLIRAGDPVMALPSGKCSKVKSIVTYDGNLLEAYPPMAITVTLEDELDISRGNMLVHVNNVPKSDSTVEAMVVWMTEKPLSSGSTFLIKQTTNVVPAVVRNLRYRMNISNLRRENANQLMLNDIGRVEFKLQRPLAYDAYSKNRSTGCFILIDSQTNATVGAAMILDREPSEPTNGIGRKIQDYPSSDTRHSLVTIEDRHRRLNQRPTVIWLTAPTSSIKSTIAYTLEKHLFDMGFYSYVLDEENLRKALSQDLCFTDMDRLENIRRASEVAGLFIDSGLIVICTIDSPYVSDRECARLIIGDDTFLEVFLETPSEFAAGKSSYEPPPNPDVHCTPTKDDVNHAVSKIIDCLKRFD